MDQEWPVLLFSKSVLKQRKFKEITGLLGDTKGLRCLDIGSDNGVISYLLRQRGGNWTSADLDEQAVASIRDLVKDNVLRINGSRTDFQENEFDRIVIVDYLEHIQADYEFIEELYRIIKPGGELIINVPYSKDSLLRKFRLFIGQTDETHGHVRPGYTLHGLTELARDKFEIESWKTYSKFFSEWIDTIVNYGFYLLKKGGATTRKGQLVTGKDIKQYQKIFRLYSLLYPIIWGVSKLDNLLVFNSGYMLIVKFKTTGRPGNYE